MRTELIRVATIDDHHRRLLDRAGLFPAPGRVTTGGHTDHPAGRPGLPRRPDGDRDEDNFNEDGSRKDRNERKPEYDVRLLCRTFVGDIGNRPLINMIFWESPDIWIEGPSGDPDIGTPGQVNKVKVHVWNIGMADAWGTHVDLYWCDPSVGIHPAVAHPIGSKTMPLYAGQHQVVSFDWVPQFVNDGHECLVAQVYDPVSDPVVAPFNPVQDRHVGQRNISVLEAPPGSSQMFKLKIPNLSLMQAMSTLEIQKLELEALDLVAGALGARTWRSAGGNAARFQAPRFVTQEMLPIDSPFMTGVFRESLEGIPGAEERRRLMAALGSLGARGADEGLAGRTIEQEPPMARVRGAAAERPPVDQGRGVRGEMRTQFRTVPWDPGIWQPSTESAGRLRLAPGQQFELTVEIDVPETARPGTADVYRVVERAAGQVTGGITLVVRTR